MVEAQDRTLIMVVAIVGIVGIVGILTTINQNRVVDFASGHAVVETPGSPEPKFFDLIECGNNLCEGEETCDTCPQDCGPCV